MMLEKYLTRKNIMIFTGIMTMAYYCYSVITGAQRPHFLIGGFIFCLICYGVYCNNKVALICFGILSIGVVGFGLLAVYMMMRWMVRGEGELGFSRPVLYLFAIVRAIFHLVLLVAYVVHKRIRRT